MSSRKSGQRGELPPFLTAYAPTRGAQRILPRFLGGRPLATGRIGEAWHVAAQRNPSQLLIADRPPDIDPQGPAVRTLTQWASLVDETTAWLHALGVRAWDRVAVLKANHFDLLVISSAVARIGAIPAPLSGTYGPPVDGAPVSHTLLRRLERPFLVTDRAHLDGCGLDPAALAALTRRTVCVDDTGGRLDVVDLASLRGMACRVTARAASSVGHRHTGRASAATGCWSAPDLPPWPGLGHRSSKELRQVVDSQHPREFQQHRADGPGRTPRRPQPPGSRHPARLHRVPPFRRQLRQRGQDGASRGARRRTASRGRLQELVRMTSCPVARVIAT
ncbi:hypothetical protein [Streptomyces noursei]|uniref:hypothetical protein n=1 Tax=Streptomyces noursei TaxID=1971 RepID=UPI0037FEC967